MKRILLFVGVIVAASMAFADESVLIDFSKLTPDILEGQEDQGILPQNKQTLMDFSSNAGTNYTPDQKRVMKTSLAIPNWLVRLAQSSQSVTNDNLSSAKVAVSKQFTNVMGVRVHFPLGNYNAWAKIVPPFDIPAYNFDEVSDGGDLSAPAEKPNLTSGTSRFESGYGVVKNVGPIKAVAVEAYGLNFPCTLSIILINGSGEEKIVNMGALNYDGWQQLRWDNLQYVSDVRNRAVRIYPLYPVYAPYIRFGGFLIQRDAGDTELVGSDFVAYFKEVRIIYDKAQLTPERDIDDEATWDIINNREANRAKLEAKNFGKELVVRYLDGARKAPEAQFVDPMADQQGGGNAQGGATQ
ncbi:MAG: flagellar filament outer layer protein FlaA [Spirochaetaceae bacterium]|jgi:hypothetical protein|nr:flagellar filament outer layer protein FlaA [Spirochaetaceae bacterium]